MKKLFVIVIIILIPLTTFAQEKILGDINNQNIKIQKLTMQELNSKLINEWGGKDVKFVELKNGKLIPMSVEKSNSLFKVQEIQDTDWWVHIVIAVGVILVVIIILTLMAGGPKIG